MNDDFQLKSYQDDLADDNMPDPFMDEQGDDPSTELGVPPEELKNELDRNEIDDLQEADFGDNEDEREDRESYFEDQDEDGDER